MKKIIPLFLVFLFFISACDEKNKENKLSQKENILCSTTWKYDTNASIKGDENADENSEGFVLKKDVKAIGDFFSGTLRFAIDSNDPTKLSYERKYGKGLFSVSVLGWWEFNKNETAIIMTEWDDVNKKELSPETKQLIKLSKDQLVLKDNKDIEHFYIPNN